MWGSFTDAGHPSGSPTTAEHIVDEFEGKRDGIIFTCTTFLSREGKFDQLWAALESIDEHIVPEATWQQHVKEAIIINECTEGDEEQ
eukprot:gene58176-biopygen18236